MKLRTASTSDASSIAALSIEVWLGTYLRRGVSGFFADYALAEFTTAKIEALLSDPEEFVVVSENEEGIDGFIRVSTSSPGPVDGCSETEISTLYVQPRHHGKGLGKSLLAAGLHHCRHNGAQSVWLATNSENTPAIDFYRSQGFTRMGHTHFRIQDRAYLNEVLSCRLTS
ncbi:GNAT family N-acetyltransferase [Thalassovita aquimarina]|uniref:GNAT family N-acetyltransferase n=1 Tax=Thalassovita aquimarina TaxID=2785917 RepID=A0ABS5HVE0_9RHOB|nr:GNAT family N-acetyltransferase [Thalassovita aquimarina]MBR9652950.1 GNAT family N-acetyltransferase [Thalassovita aquimarina]